MLFESIHLLCMLRLWNMLLYIYLNFFISVFERGRGSYPCGRGGYPRGREGYPRGREGHPRGRGGYLYGRGRGYAYRRGHVRGNAMIVE